MSKKIMSLVCVLAFSTQALAVGATPRSLASVLSACDSEECQYEAVWRYSSYVDANGVSTEQLQQDAQALGSITDKAAFLAYGFNNGFIKKNQFDYAVANINKASDEQSALALVQGFESVGGTGAALNPSTKRGLAKGACITGLGVLAALVVFSSQWYLIPFVAGGFYCGPKVVGK